MCIQIKTFRTPEKIFAVHSYIKKKEEMKKKILKYEVRPKQTGRRQVTSKELGFSRAQQNQNRTVAHIYVASPAGRQSSATGWATLGLSLSSGPRRSNAAPGPLGTCPQTCHIKSAPERSPPFTLISEPSVRPLGILGFMVSVSHQMPV